MIFDKVRVDALARQLEAGTGVEEKLLRRLVARYRAVGHLYPENREDSLRAMVRGFYSGSPMRETWTQQLSIWGFVDLLIIMREELHE